jgi:AcrR family transcriptional regulator
VTNRDPEATKARILDAARREFSEKGISGARVDAIAERAGVNKRMLYYYFESKDGLFREILRHRLIERTATLRDTASDPDRLATRTERVASESDITRLLMWEALELDPDHPVNEDIRRGVYEGWVQAVEDEQRAGRIPSDLDAAQLVLSEICLTLGPFLLPQLTRLVTGFAEDDPEFIERRQAFLRVLTSRLAATQPSPL